MMVVDNKYDIGDRVYLVTDPEQSECIITAIVLKPSGHIYELSCGVSSSLHFDIELTTERNEVKALKENGNL